MARLYGVSPLPSLIAPAGVLTPTKVSREPSVPLTALLPGLMVSLLPLFFAPGVAAAETSASIWKTPCKPSAKVCAPRTPKRERLLAMSGIQWVTPCGVAPTAPHELALLQVTPPNPCVPWSREMLSRP